ncbi:MAG: glutathione S-transferase family protein [Micavibrio aeruginosavorus]|nr:glutathione S-transferase family protein [Micavibrio aeruginosavorus]
MYTLYYKPGACSMAVHVVLNELGIPFEAVRQDDLKAPDFLKLNPRGQVPLLLIDGEPVKEGAAMIVYLLDMHNSPLLPKYGVARAKALEWLMWCNASLYPAAARMFWLNRQTLDEAARAELSKSIVAQVQSLWDEADARLAQTRYLAGDQVTAADILLTVIANWGLPVTLGDNVKRVLREIIARPSYRAALNTEKVEYKAVA